MKSAFSRFGLLLVLGGCGAGGTDPNTASCVVTAAGGCSGIVGTGGSTSASPTPPAEVLFKPSATTTYPAVGGSIAVNERYSASGRTETYISSTASAESGRLSVAYNPTTAAFTVRVSQAGAAVNILYDDPLFRTAFGQLREPQQHVPNIQGFEYLSKKQTDSLPNIQETFFYQTPGQSTRYVTLAGFVRHYRDLDNPTAVRAFFGPFDRLATAMVLGTPSPASSIPMTGRATYQGNMLATAVYNLDIDTVADVRSRLDWIYGTANVSVDFAKGTIATELTGSFVDLPFSELAAQTPEGALRVSGFNRPNAGVPFAASGTASFTTGRNTYTGTITDASVGGTAIKIGIGTMEGGFYGPAAQETGGAFRIQGAGPDQRVEIIGAFAGSK